MWQGMLRLTAGDMQVSPSSIDGSRVKLTWNVALTRSPLQESHALILSRSAELLKSLPPLSSSLSRLAGLGQVCVARVGRCRLGSRGQGMVTDWKPYSHCWGTRALTTQHQAYFIKVKAVSDQAADECGFPQRAALRRIALTTPRSGIYSRLDTSRQSASSISGWRPYRVALARLRHVMTGGRS
jgi:hypothetical protein